MRLVVALVAVLAAGIASAEPEPWMKKANPDELTVVIFGGQGCPAPMSPDKLVETVEGVLVRSRIKMIRDTPSSENAAGTFPWLAVIVGCQDDLYQIGVDFIVQDAAGYRHRAGLFGYGSAGNHADDGTFMLNSVRRNVESAITDYLKVNFDL